MSLSRLAMVLDLQLFDVLWMLFWMLLILGIYTFSLVVTAMDFGRNRYIRREVPIYQNGIIKDLRFDNKELRRETVKQEKELEEYRVKFKLIKESLK